MFKTYTLMEVEEEQVTDTEGKVTYHLTDENGESRKVTGSTQLDANLNAMSVSTTQKREHPLIQCLFYTEINETIDIEFKQYNHVFERKENEVTEQTIEELAKKMQEKPLRVGELLKSTEPKKTESIH